MQFPRWRLEAFKMMIYLAFPVGSFYYFNQPEYFEEYVIKMKRTMYPPDDGKDRALIEEVQRRWNAGMDDEFQKALLEYEQKETQKTKL